MINVLVALVFISQWNGFHSKPIVGTNLGGLFVLEPWITPSLFYRFLEEKPLNFGLDSYSFCAALGPKKGNDVMRQHWDLFYTEQDIKDLSERVSVHIDNFLTMPSFVMHYLSMIDSYDINPFIRVLKWYVYQQGIGLCNHMVPTKAAWMVWWRKLTGFLILAPNTMFQFFQMFTE